MAGLDPAIQSLNENAAYFFWMAASEGGHDDEASGNVGVIKRSLIEDGSKLNRLPFRDPSSRFARPG
jgi:hypothetical protein